MSSSRTLAERARNMPPDPDRATRWLIRLIQVGIALTALTAGFVVWAIVFLLTRQR